MKRLLALLALSLCARATTTVTATITAPTGDLVSGSCSIQAIGPFTSGAYRVVGAPVVVKFTAGVFSAALTPTDSATPSGQYYKVTCSVPSQTVNGRSVGPFSWGPKIWLVPTSATPLDIGAVEVSTAPAPSVNVLPTQLATGGTDLQALVKDGTSARGMKWATIAVGTGGGISGTATWAQIEAGTAGAGTITGTMTWAQIEAQ
jgi:hypothetical protein